MSEWKPIETAPERERVLVFVPRKSGKKLPTIIAAQKTGIQWWAINIGALRNPTHWMPLPNPPQ